MFYICISDINYIVHLVDIQNVWSDLNSNIECMPGACVVGEFDVEDMSDNGRVLLDMCVYK